MGGVCVRHTDQIFLNITVKIINSVNLICSIYVHLRDTSIHVIRPTKAVCKMCLSHITRRSRCRSHRQGNNRNVRNANKMSKCVREPLGHYKKCLKLSIHLLRVMLSNTKIL